MNIFIYGNQSFKKDIQKILKDSKINDILENTNIVEINELVKLQESIASNPNDVYLIDDDKIIKKSGFKFLKPKDGIEEEFLLQCGVSDLSIDSLEEIPNYIIRKYERQNQKEDVATELKEEDMVLDSELSELLESKNQQDSETMQSSVLEEPVGLDIKELDNLIESEPISSDNKDNPPSLEDFSEDFGLNNISYDYDDDSVFNDSSKSDEDILTDILNTSIIDDDDFEFVGETFEGVNFLDEIFPNKTILEPSFEKIEPIFPEENVEHTNHIDFFESDSEVLENTIEDKKEEIEPLVNDKKDIIDSIEDFNKEKKEILLKDINEEKRTEGDSMNDEFLELDSLSEQDLMDALDGVSTTSSLSEDTKRVEEKQNIEFNSSNVQDVATLISQLLNNKTLEITIKIKD